MAIQWMEAFGLWTSDHASGATIGTPAAGRGWATQSSSGNSHIYVEAGGRFGSGRCRLNPVNNSEYAMIYKDLATNRAKVGVIFSLYFSNGLPGNLDGVLRLFESGTTHIELRFNGTVFYFTRNGTYLTQGTFAPSANTWIGMEVWVEIHDTTGVLKLFINGNATPDINWSGGDTRNGGSGVVTTVQFRDLGHGSGSNNVIVSDVVVYDDQGSVNNLAPLGDLRVERIVPTGAGATTQMTPSAGANWQTVDETVANGDTDYVSETTVGEKDTYALGNLASGAGGVLAAQVTASARKSDAGSKSLATILRSSGGTEDQGPDVALGTSYAFTQRTLNAVPGGAAWDQTEVNGLEAGAIVTV